MIMSESKEAYVTISANHWGLFFSLKPNHGEFILGVSFNYQTPYFISFQIKRRKLDLLFST